MARRIEIDEGLLETALQRMGHSVVMLDAAGAITHASESCEALIGHRPADLVGRPVGEFLTNDSQAIFARHFEARRSGDRTAYEMTWQHRDGGKVDILVLPAPLLGHDGSFAGSLGVLTDMAESRRIEREQATAKMILDQSNAVVYRAELAEDVFIEQISGNLGHFGYAAGDPSVGRLKLRHIVHPEDWASILAECNAAVGRGAKRVVQRYRVRTGTGDWRWVEDHTLVHPAPAGKPVYLEGLVQDISELKHADKARHRALVQTIRAVAATIEKRDPYTAGHQHRVAELAEAIGRALGLPADRLEGLMLGGLVHDVGKIAVPTEILAKPGILAQAEYELVKTHTVMGEEILAGIELPWPIAAMVAQHHERLDGSGYPRALKGTDILLEARIIAVADVVEAMTSHRPYRPALGLRLAAREISSHRERQFDPAVVDACLDIIRKADFKPEGVWHLLADERAGPPASRSAIPGARPDDARD